MFIIEVNHFQFHERTLHIYKDIRNNIYFVYVVKYPMGVFLKYLVIMKEVQFVIFLNMLNFNNTKVFLFPKCVILKR